MAGNLSPEKIEAKVKESQALELRRAGLDYNRIAQAVGYETAAEAKRAIADALARLSPIDDIALVRRMEVDRLDTLMASRWKAAVSGDDGAMDRVLRILERRAKLLGLDSPSQSVLSGPGGGPIQMDVVAAATNILESLEQRLADKTIIDVEESTGIMPEVGPIDDDLLEEILDDKY